MLDEVKKKHIKRGKGRGGGRKGEGGGERGGERERVREGGGERGTLQGNSIQSMMTGTTLDLCCNPYCHCVCRLFWYSIPTFFSIIGGAN